MTESSATRCGFVTIIGAPNAGKSTLTNALVGSKVSIVSPKVQTTRIRVKGIVMRDNAQIILIDTPGIFQPKKRLDRAMVAAAWEGQQDADIIAVIIDISRKSAGKEAKDLLKKVHAHDAAKGKKLILLLNKTDHAKPEDYLPIAQELNDAYDFSATFMISAQTGRCVDDLSAWLAKNIPEGSYLYPEDELSDLPERLLAAEITREKLFLQMHEEIPYALTVETESWEEFENGDVKISQVIFIARDAHKPMILGKGGSRIKQIGQASRTELEKILDRRVHLNLFVKVKENWMDDPERFRVWGLDHSS